MIKNDLKLGKVGRPKKSVLARKQTCLWAESVRVRSGAASFRELEARLGDEGRWEGMWSRYERGLVVPSGKRMGRIEMMVPGTQRYFNAGFWQLLENRFYSWEELDDAIGRLPPWLFPELRRTAKFGRISSNKKDEYLQAAVEMVADVANGIYGIAVILILLREAELAQDERQYITALRAWGYASEMKGWHPILRGIPIDVFEAVARPLSDITFADPEINESWERFMSFYLERFHQGKRPAANDIYWMHYIVRFLSFIPQPEEVLERFLKYSASERADYIRYLSWGQRKNEDRLTCRV